MGDVYCFGKYVGILKDAFIEYKFRNSVWLGQLFGEMIYESFRDILNNDNYDYLTYVPVSLGSFKNRGFDQCLEIVKVISKKSGIKLVRFLDCSSLKTKQSKLTRNGREINVKGKFKPNSKNIELISNKRIILFDDILTTGATLKECGNILMENGAIKVDAMVMATGRADLVRKLE